MEGFPAVLAHTILHLVSSCVIYTFARLLISLLCHSSKIVLCTLSGLFIGFSFFRADTSQQGLQNQMFSLFMLMTIFGNLVQQSEYHLGPILPS